MIFFHFRRPGAYLFLFIFVVFPLKCNPEFDAYTGSKIASVDIGSPVVRMTYSPTSSHTIIAILEVSCHFTTFILKQWMCHFILLDHVIQYSENLCDL